MGKSVAVSVILFTFAPVLKLDLRNYWQQSRKTAQVKFGSVWIIKHQNIITMRDLFIEAVRAYAKACKYGTPILFHDGEYRSLTYCEPSETTTEIGRKYVYLRNCNGLLAKYNIKTRQIIV